MTIVSQIYYILKAEMSLSRIFVKLELGAEFQYSLSWVLLGLIALR